MINKILTQLEATSSRLEKERILSANKSNATLREVVHLALNPLINFYIKKIPEYSPRHPTQRPFNIDWALKELGRLSRREVTGNDAIAHLHMILISLVKEDSLVIEKIIKRDLRCGVSEATANKIWKDLIPEYPVMLATAYSEKAVEKIRFPAYAQCKLDGMRFNAIVKGGEVEFFSRNGKTIDLLGELSKEFAAMAGKKDVVFDGELLVADSMGVPLDRKTGNGILNKAVKGTISKKEAALVRATLWDIIDYEEFCQGKSNKKYSERFERLLSLKFSPRISDVESVEVKTLDEARKVFEDFLLDGQEGIILKDKSGIWENKRSKYQVKFKGELECDLLCVGWEYGTGKNIDRLGALKLESSCRTIKTSVGSGFSDDDRDNIKKDVIGKVVTVKYNARIQDKRTGQQSLFLPIFLEIREDKTKADAAKDIK